MSDSKTKQQRTSDDRSETALGTLAATWAHRLGNTLGLIRAIVHDAEESIEDRAKVATLLHELELIASKELDASKDLMSLSRLSAASEMGPVDVNSLIRTVSSEFYEEALTARGVELQLDLSPELPHAKADEKLLIEVLRNLLDNSIRALKDRSDGAVRLKTSSDARVIDIDIIDNGSGIPSKLRNQIFHNTISTRPDKSAGFGLLISQSLVETWGGSLTLKHTDDSGTVFRISLPKWEPSPDIQSARRALVVDNSLEWLHAVSRHLNERGLDVDTASSAAAAISLLSRRQYDLALFDLRLGDDENSRDVSGLHLARRVRELNPEALTVLMSGYAALDVVREAFRSGVDDVMDKASFTRNGLNKVLERIAVRRETRRESLRQSQVNKLMYEGLSIVSHELRSPLLVIQRNAEALAAGALGDVTPQQRDAIKAIQSSVRREFVLLNAHLDLNRIEKGAEQLQYQEYDLVELMREEISAHRDEANRKNIEIQSHLPKRKAIVKIDVNRFRVALNPLMDNAIKFSPDGCKVSILVLLKAAYVEVQISDQGPGIKPDELERLLNLQTLESATFTQRMRNSGLGLSMSKRMIELHEGKLWIESDGEIGTTVSFRLPVSI